MLPTNYRNLVRAGFASLAMATLFGASVNFSYAATPRKGETFVIGTDAPLASVASFTVTLQSIQVTGPNGASAQLLSSPATVDFARFNGLQTLIDINDAPVGTYNQITVTLAQPSIGYLARTSGAPPTIQTITPTLVTNTVSKELKTPLIVTESEPVGIRMDFDLHKSILVQNGQISSFVDPVFNIGVVTPSSPGAFIDEFNTAVISADQGTQTFTVQGPHGRMWTVAVTPNTEWDGGSEFSDLNANAIVQISGTVERSSSTITADEISVLSEMGFYAGGLATYVTPSSGAASSFDMYVRGLLPASGTGATGVKLGQIATVDLSGKEKYFVRWHRTPLTEFVFNSSALLPGQNLAVGGPVSGAMNENAVSVRRVNLRDWGYVGKVVPGSVNKNRDTFKMQVDGFAGLLVPQTVTVYTEWCHFRYGFTALGDLDGGDTVRVVGLLLKNTVNDNTVLVSHYVDALN